jgi:hypothetical protein
MTTTTIKMPETPAPWKAWSPRFRRDPLFGLQVNHRSDGSLSCGFGTSGPARSRNGGAA